MKRIPSDIENLIIDYMWSHRMYVLKSRLHHELMYFFFRRLFRYSWMAFVEHFV